MIEFLIALFGGGTKFGEEGDSVGRTLLKAVRQLLIGVLILAVVIGAMWVLGVGGF